jgi:hypothetical protein
LVPLSETEVDGLFGDPKGFNRSDGDPPSGLADDPVFPDGS